MPEQDARSPLARVGVAVGLTAGAVAVVLAFAHVALTPINPKQKVPDRHVTWNCAVCHTVSDTAKLVEESD